MHITDSAQCMKKQEMVQKPHNVPVNRSVDTKKAEKEKNPNKVEKAEKAEKAENPVSVELSERGRAMARLADSVKTSKRAAKTGKKKRRPTSDLSRALAIARRIMHGDKVPPKDESFLFRYNSDLYLKAKMMAALQENPKKHKSLLEDEEEEENGGSAKVHSSSSSEASEETSESSDSEEEGGE